MSLRIRSVARGRAASMDKAWAWLEDRLGATSDTGGEVAAMFTKPIQQGPLRQGGMIRTTGSRGTQGLARIQRYDRLTGICELWFLKPDGSPWRLHSYQFLQDDGADSCTVQLHVEIRYDFGLDSLLLVLIHNLWPGNKEVLAQSCLQGLR